MLPRSVSIKALATSTFAVLVTLNLTSCAPSGDVLHQGPDATTNYVSELLERGDGKGLCDLQNLAEPGSCTTLLDSSGLGAKPIKEVQVSPLDSSNTKTTFRDPRKDDPSASYTETGWNFSVEAQPITSENGKSWQYKMSWNNSARSISLPFGGQLGDENLAAGKSYDIMPGGLAHEVAVTQDKSGWTSTSFDSETYNVESQLTAKGTTAATEAGLAKCSESEAGFKPDLKNFYINRNFGSGAVEMQPLSKMRISKACYVKSISGDSNSINLSTSFQATMRGQQKASWLFSYTKSTYTADVDQFFTWSRDSSGEWSMEPAQNNNSVGWVETTP